MSSRPGHPVTHPTEKIRFPPFSIVFFPTTGPITPTARCLLRLGHTTPTPTTSLTSATFQPSPTHHPQVIDRLTGSKWTKSYIEPKGPQGRLLAFSSSSKALTPQEVRKPTRRSPSVHTYLNLPSNIFPPFPSTPQPRIPPPETSSPENLLLFRSPRPLRREARSRQRIAIGPLLRHPSTALGDRPRTISITLIVAWSRVLVALSSGRNIEDLQSGGGAASRINGDRFPISQASGCRQMGTKSPLTPGRCSR